MLLSQKKSPVNAMSTFAICVKPRLLKFLHEGTWLDNLRDGVGIAIYPNGDRFEGIWRRGQRNGRGRYWFANSSEQDSLVKEEGERTSLVASSTSSCLQGVWVDDIFNAGTLTTTPIIYQQHEEEEDQSTNDLSDNKN